MVEPVGRNLLATAQGIAEPEFDNDLRPAHRRLGQLLTALAAAVVTAYAGGRRPALPHLEQIPRRLCH